MQQIVDIYIVYKIVKKLTTPFEKTTAYELGIIDGKGRVLKPRRTLTTPAEKDAWTWLDILLNNIKRALAVIPGGSSRFFAYAAAYFLLQEPIVKLKEMSRLKGTPLLESMFGPSSDKYLMGAMNLTEDVGAVGGPGLGPAAGAGSGYPGPEPTPSIAIPETFAGCRVFGVDSDTFQKCRFGKKKHARYEQYVGSTPIGEEIRNYGRKYRKKGIIIMDQKSGVMFYLRRPQGVLRWK